MQPTITKIDLTAGAGITSLCSNNDKRTFKTFQCAFYSYTIFERVYSLARTLHKFYYFNYFIFNYFS